MMGMLCNDFVVLEWSLNTFSLRKGLERQFLQSQVPGQLLHSLAWTLGPLRNLRHSRIPAVLFRDIVTDMLIQYGTLQNYGRCEIT